MVRSGTLRHFVEALSNCVRRVCQDLAAIEEQISSTDSPAAAEDATIAEDMKALKGAIDETRAALWTYFQRTHPDQKPLASAFAQKIPPPAPVGAADLRQKEELCSFFDEIQMLATRIVEKHMSARTGPAADLPISDDPQAS
jgi:hypothetical protein